MNAMFDFRSDNCGRAAPELIEALTAANTGSALGYGGDTLTATLQTRLSEVFETPLRVFPVPTGTAANAIALAASATPFSAIYCSQEAHINTSECNAVGFFGGGTKLVPVSGSNGKVDAAEFERVLASAGIGSPQKSQPAAVNLVQATDLGALYRNDEVQAISQIAHSYGLQVHMDGARFANALVRMGCTPAQASWRAGVDILSLGVTKNGGLLTDAIVVFTPDSAANIAFHLRRAGVVFSKMRFASAQILAYVKDDLWLRLARQANDSADKIAQHIQNVPGVTLVAPVQANELFIDMAPEVFSCLESDGILFQRRSSRMGRFVCRWDTSDEDVSALSNSIARHA